MILAALVHNRTEAETARDLRAKGFCAYYPQETMDRVIMGRKRRFRRPAFPGYIFTECFAAEDIAEIRKLKSVYAFVVTRLPDGSKTPASVSPEALQAVFLAELFGELDYTRKPEAWQPTRGERVKVKAGLWKGYIAKVLSMTKTAAVLQPEKGGRLKVKLDELERAA
jgi:transcription antitermination factor NusG